MNVNASVTTGRRAVSVGKNAIGALLVQFSTLLSQLLLAPLLISEWGGAGYGTWAHALALPLMTAAYADVGIGTVAANRAFSDEHDARQIVNKALRVAAVSLLALSAICYLANLFSLPTNSVGAAANFLVVLYGAVLCAQTVVLAFARNSPANPRVLATFAACKVLEVLAVAVLVRSSAARAESVAMVLCASGGLFVVLAVVALRREHAWLKCEKATVTKQDAFGFLIPGLSVVAFPAGMAAALQWPVLVAAAHAGPDQIAAFVTLRTLTRITYQQANIVCSAFWGKLRQSIVSKKQGEAVRTIRCANLLTFAALSSSAAGLAMVAEPLYSMWVGSDRWFSSELCWLLLVQSIISGCWLVRALPLTTTNMHARFTWFYVVANSIALATLLFMNNVSIREIVLAGVVVEMACYIRVSRESSKAIKAI